MQIQKIQPSIKAAQAADDKKIKNQRINLRFSFTFVSYKSLYILYYMLVVV